MCPKLQNSAAVKKDNNNKYLTFNTNFDIRHSKLHEADISKIKFQEVIFLKAEVVYACPPISQMTIDKNGPLAFG